MRNEILQAGFLLVDERLKPQLFNSEALKILAYPTAAKQISHADTFLADRLRSSLLPGKGPSYPVFPKEITSGRRRYTCRAFALEPQAAEGLRQGTVVLLQRTANSLGLLPESSRMFEFTEREKQTVQLLAQGLTSKEIAVRLGISPNTVKAFVRLVMVKMGVTTRSGIVGKLYGSQV